MVGVTKIGRRNANYWINAVAEGGEDYYTKPGEAPGEWMGELAAELDLAGDVDRDAYAAVLAGKHPQTGEALVRRPAPRRYVDDDGRERRLDPILGYDVRFSAPKSVSLLYAVGSPEVRGGDPPRPRPGGRSRRLPTWSDTPALCSAAREARQSSPASASSRWPSATAPRAPAIPPCTPTSSPPI